METPRTDFHAPAFFMTGLAALLFLIVSPARAEDGNGGPISMAYPKSGKDQPASEHFYVTEDHGWIRWRNYEEKDPSEERPGPGVYEVQEKEIPQSDAEDPEDREKRWLAKGISLKFDR